MVTSRLRTPPAPASPSPAWHPAPLSRQPENYKTPKKLQEGAAIFLASGTTSCRRHPVEPGARQIRDRARHRPLACQGASSVSDIQWNSADFLAVLVRDQNGKMPVLQIGTLLPKTPNDCLPDIHCRDIVRCFGAAPVGDGFGVDKIEVIAGHEAFRG